MKKNNITKETIIQSTRNTTISLREGVCDLFNVARNKNIPVIIISCSLKNIIIEFLKQNNIYSDNIHVFANHYDKVKENRIYNITPYNKEKIIEENDDFKKIINNSKKIYLFGDMLEDIKMIGNNYMDKTIKVGFLNNNIEENITSYKKNFDYVYTNVEKFID